MVCIKKGKIVIELMDMALAIISVRVTSVMDELSDRRNVRHGGEVDNRIHDNILLVDFIILVAIKKV